MKSQKRANEGREMAQQMKVLVTQPDPCGGGRGGPLTHEPLPQQKRKEQEMYIQIGSG